MRSKTWSKSLTRFSNYHRTCGGEIFGVLNRGGPYLFKSLKEVVAYEGFDCSSSST